MARVSDVNQMYSVKLDNITVTQDDFVAVKEELREKFSKFGDIGDVYIPRDRNFAFVRFREKRDAEDAVDAMEGKTDILGQEVRVTMASQAKKAAEDYAKKGRGRRSRSRRRRSDSRSRSYSESSSSSRDRRRRKRGRDDSRSRRRRR
eukprot:symbB.v1.2.027110.t1/scaffold2756.1/size127779/3